jgi:hypothetical protein
MTGEVVVEGRRLDAPAPPISPIVLSATPDGYGEVGFLPSGLLFPSKGCWEVVATGEKFNLTFVTLVAKVSFEPRQAYWLPEGMLHLDTDVSNLPQSIGKIYGFANGDRGQIIVETAQGKRTNPDSYSKVARQPVEVSGLPGTCVQGAWDKRGQWQSDAYAGILAWMDGEFSYRISYSELELSCADLLRVAGSSS